MIGWIADAHSGKVSGMKGLVILEGERYGRIQPE